MMQDKEMLFEIVPRADLRRDIQQLGVFGHVAGFLCSSLSEMVKLSSVCNTAMIPVNTSGHAMQEGPEKRNPSILLVVR